MNVVVKFIENNEVYINIIAFILTLIGTSVSVCSWWKIRGYKKEILGKLDYVDFSAFLSKFYSVVQDLSKTSDSENNNRGGKLYKILDDISVLMTETLNILKNLSDADKDKIKSSSNDVKNYIMTNRINNRINVVFLREKLDNIYEILHNSLDNQKIKKL